jgi:hypothetical protein
MGNPVSAPAQLDRDAVAARYGIRPSTVTRYMHPDRARYKFPPPDGRIGGHPWWYETTLDAFDKIRPGKGAGAGRPRKKAPDA